MDDISELFMLTGLAISSIYERNPEDNRGVIRGRNVEGTVPLFMASERKSRRATITTQDKRNLVQTTSYSGMVYCVTVPNGTLVVRRNKKTLVCGNCARYLLESGADYVTKEKPGVGPGTFSY
jgi:hypothetical protein